MIYLVGDNRNAKSRHFAHNRRLKQSASRVHRRVYDNGGSVRRNHFLQPLNIKLVALSRTVVSNIHAQGTPAVEAGAHIAGLLETILQKKKSGVALNLEAGA